MDKEWSDEYRSKRPWRYYYAGKKYGWLKYICEEDEKQIRAEDKQTAKES
jgi:hypothetical protein